MFAVPTEAKTVLVDTSLKLYVNVYQTKYDIHVSIDLQKHFSNI